LRCLPEAAATEVEKEHSAAGRKVYFLKELIVQKKADNEHPKQNSLLACDQSFIFGHFCSVDKGRDSILPVKCYNSSINAEFYKV